MVRVAVARWAHALSRIRDRCQTRWLQLRRSAHTARSGWQFVGNENDELSNLRTPGNRRTLQVAALARPKALGSA
jgi:hypothetical protein